MFAFGLPLRIDGIKYKSRVDRNWHFLCFIISDPQQRDFVKSLQNKMTEIIWFEVITELKEMMHGK